MSPYDKHLNVRNHLLAFATKLVLLLVFAVGTATEAAQETSLTISVKTSDGQTLSGELVALQGNLLEMTSNRTNQTLAFEQIERIDLAQTDSKAPSASLQCRLADGSRFNATKLSISAGRATLNLSSNASITLAQSSLKSVLLFDTANDANKLKQWNEFLTDFAAASDSIIAQKNDALQAIEGIVGDVGEEGFDFEMGGRQVTVKAEKLTGVIFYRAERDFPDFVCEVQLIGGSTIAAAQIELSNGNVNIATGTGDQISLPSEIIASLNLSAGRSIYLSDLLPTTNDWKPLVASQANLDNLAKLNLSVANENFSGQPLSLRTLPTDGLSFLAKTQTYERGFAIQAGGRLAFNLNGQFKRLTALAGFDPEMEALPGNVQIEIQVDNRTVVSKVLENRRLVQPLPIDVDLVGAKRLIIRVNYHDGRSVGDRIHLVDARLSR